MTDAWLECTYCGVQWGCMVSGVADLRCSRCGDTNVRARPRETARLDTYVGCPAFETKAELEARVAAWHKSKNPVPEALQEPEAVTPYSDYSQMYIDWSD